MTTLCTDGYRVPYGQKRYRFFGNKLYVDSDLDAQGPVGDFVHYENSGWLYDWFASDWLGVAGISTTAADEADWSRGDKLRQNIHNPGVVGQIQYILGDLIVGYNVQSIVQRGGTYRFEIDPTHSRWIRLGLDVEKFVFGTVSTRPYLAKFKEPGTLGLTTHLKEVLMNDGMSFADILQRWRIVVQCCQNRNSSTINCAVYNGCGGVDGKQHNQSCVDMINAMIDTGVFYLTDGQFSPTVDDLRDFLTLFKELNVFNIRDHLPGICKRKGYKNNKIDPTELNEWGSVCGCFFDDDIYKEYLGKIVRQYSGQFTFTGDDEQVFVQKILNDFGLSEKRDCYFPSCVSQSTEYTYKEDKPKGYCKDTVNLQICYNKNNQQFNQNTFTDSKLDNNQQCIFNLSTELQQVPNTPQVPNTSTDSGEIDVQGSPPDDTKTVDNTLYIVIGSITTVILIVIAIYLWNLHKKKKKSTNIV